MSDPTCPDCSSSMEAGFILDMSHAQRYPSSWIAGPPESSFWTRLKIRGKPRFEITAYRCRRCGLLKSFATPPRS